MARQERLAPPPDVLRRMVDEEKLSFREIARRSNCSPESIRRNYLADRDRRLREAGALPPRGQKRLPAKFAEQQLTEMVRQFDDPNPPPKVAALIAALEEAGLKVALDPELGYDIRDRRRSEGLFELM